MDQVHGLKKTPAPKTVNYFNQDILVGLEWNDITKIEKKEIRVLKQNPPASYATENNTKDTKQIAFLDPEYHLHKVVTPEIIQKILSTNDDITSHWVFFHQVDEEKVWFFICDELGFISSDTDRVVDVTEFMDILDEYILVSDIPDNLLKIFSNNFEIFDDFEDIIEKIIYEHSHAKLTGISKYNIKKFLGVGLINFLLLCFSIILMIFHIKVDDILPPPEPSFKGFLPRVKITDPDPKWKMLDVISTKTSSYREFLFFLNNTVEEVPIDINGWALKGIFLINKEVTIIYTKDKTSTISHTVAKSNILKKLMDNKIVNSRGELAVFIPIKRKEIRISFNLTPPKEFQEADYLEIKTNLGQKDKELARKNSKKIGATFRSLTGQENVIVSDYFKNFSATKYYLFFTSGHQEIQASLNNISVKKQKLSIAQKINNEVMEKMIIAPQDLLNQRATRSAKFDEIMAMDLENNFLKITPSPDKASKKFIKSTFKAKGVGLNNLIKNIEFLIKYPFRYRSVEYKWKNSKWKLEGRIYEYK